MVEGGWGAVEVGHAALRRHGGEVGEPGGVRGEGGEDGRKEDGEGFAVLEGDASKGGPRGDEGFEELLLAADSTLMWISLRGLRDGRVG